MFRILFAWIALIVVVPADAEPAADEAMPIATKVSAPFAFRDADDRWTGISIELWDRIARELDLPEPEYREFPLDKMLEQVEQGQAAAAVAAISVS